MLYDWRHVSQRRLTEQTLFDEAWIAAKLELLEQLAYQFSCEYKEMFSMRELLTKIEECKGGTALKHLNSPDIIKELSQEDGIIQQLDGQGHKTRYIFLHRTFQEYLTASYLKRHPNSIELAKAHFWDFDWHETLILFAGLADDPELFLNTLLAERDDIFHMLLLLAGKCLAECPQLVLPQLVERLYNVWRVKLYCKFVEPTVVVVSQTHQRMLTHLLAALHDSDSYVRWSAVDVLGKIGGMRAVEGLLAAIHNPNRDVRERAVGALGKIGNARAVEGLLAALHDADKEVRNWAAIALGQLGDARAVEGLLDALHDPDSSIRGRAADALGKIGYVQAVKYLLDALYDTYSFVRHSAAKALGQIGDARAVEGLLEALYDEDEFVRGQAADALEKIGDARAVEGLLVALHSLDRDVRKRVAKALGKIGGVRVVEGLLVALRDPDKNVRGRASDALEKIGTLEVLETLLHRLDIDIYDYYIFPVVRRLAITFNHQQPQPACLPVYPQHLFLRLLKKGFWRVRDFWHSL